MELKPWKKSSNLFADLEQFHIKNQCRVRRNCAACSGSSITQLRRNSQLPLASDFHSRNPFVPAFYYLPLSQWKRKRLATVTRAVKFLAGRQKTGIVNLDRAPGRCRCAGANYDVPVLKAGRSCCRLAAYFHGTGRAGCAGAR